jgi:polyisoprenoid-binding protein YceI
MAANENMAVRYRIDPRQSQFIVQAEATGLLSFVGHNPVIAICGFGGDARFVPGTLHQASLLMLVQANSLAVVGEVSDKDRPEIERAMREDVLEIARYPEIVYMSTSVTTDKIAEGQYRAKIGGSLSLHGATRSHSVDAELAVNGGNLRARGEFTLRQSDYNIKQFSVIGGTLKVKDELKFSFDIKAIAD